jgi:coproporphyrinogen III oxidase-like Fe-S oxidoreductase
MLSGSRHGSRRGSGYGEIIEQISAKAFFLEHLLCGLRLSEGLQRKRMEDVFGVDPAIPIAKTLGRWREKVDVTSEFFRLTDEGRRFLDAFLKEAADEIDNHDFPICNWP